MTVIVHKDQAAHNRVWALRLRMLEIIVTRPNPDDLADLGEKIRQRLAEQNAKEQSTTLTAEENAELKPNEETKMLATIGLTDGSVRGRGYDPVLKRTVEETTESTPLLVPQEWNPAEENAPGIGCAPGVSRAGRSE